MNALAAACVLFAGLSSPGLAQAQYKCKTETGSTIFSDRPCPTGTRQEQAAQAPAPSRQFDAAPTNGSARMLTAKVAEALGSGDFARAKSLALTPEHWQMIAAAEQGTRRTVTGRTDADLRAEAKNSPECQSAQRSYEVEASSIRKDAAQINATKRRMYSACGMNEPTVVENRTVINDHRRVVGNSDPSRRLNCRQSVGGRIDCW